MMNESESIAHFTTHMPPSTTRTFAEASDQIQQWFVHSSPHGVRRISRATTRSEQILWSFIFVIFAVLMGTFIYSAIAKYLDHPARIHLSIKHDLSSDDYPAITLCNANVFNEEILLSEHSTNVDLLVRCVFNERVCYRNLTELFHPTFGSCRTFDNVHHVRLAEAPDMPHYWSRDDLDGEYAYRLLLELVFRQPESPLSSDHRAAFRLFIHRKQEIPMLSQNSILLRPNRYTKLSFSRRVTSFSHDCRTEPTDDMRRVFQGHSVRYTRSLCYKLCEQRLVEQRCRCVAPKFAVFYRSFSDTRTTPTLCPAEDPCHHSPNGSSSDPQERCSECLPECELVQYSVQSSHASYPNTKAYNSVYQRVRQHFRRVRKNSSYPSDPHSLLHDNIVAVEISASPYPTELLTESPVYTWIDLISSIGGQTGLWIGISLIGLVEIIELVCQVFPRCISTK